MARRSVPFRKRFQWGWYREKHGFQLRIVFGFIYLLFRRNYPLVEFIGRYATGVQIGWIPLKIEESQMIPAKRFERIWDDPMETF